MAGWTDLPLDILVSIAQHMTVIDDFHSFSAICKDCQSIGAMLKKKISLPPRYPRLMLAENKHNPSLRGFLNLLTSTTIEVELPEATDRFCLGTDYGWLFTLGFDLQMNLLHPFSRQQIGLPPMLALPDEHEYDEKFTPQMDVNWFVQKIAISTSPLKGNNLNYECVIIAIYGKSSKLAVARIGDTVWTNIQVSSECYVDVVHHKGKFYVVTWHGDVDIVDINDNNDPKATRVVNAPHTTCAETQKYLVASMGDLLLVFRESVLLDKEVGYLVDDDGNEYCRAGEENNVDNGSDKKENKPNYYTTKFLIWRLDECHKEGNNCPCYEWTPVTRLGDRALFLGRNVSTSKASSDGIKANCIYFTDNYYECYGSEPDGGGWDTGFVNIEDGIIHFDYTRESLSKLSPSLWYI